MDTHAGSVSQGAQALKPGLITQMEIPDPMPDSGVPQIFDIRLAAERLARAWHQPGRADFLLLRAADDLDDRLALILRNFEAILDLATPGGMFGQRARERHAGASLTHAATGAFGAARPAVLAYPDFQPFKPASFDLAVSGLSLHLANDLPGALAQARRALRPDGLLMACLPGGRTLFELRTCLAEAESAVTGGISPRVAPFADVRDMGGLLQRAGFALPVADSETLIVRYDSLFALMADLRRMGATNALKDRLRRPTGRAVFLAAAKLYQERFSDPDGRIRATFELVWISGWAPHESQQKPLRPGSAKMRLAEALGVPDHGSPLSDP